MTGIVLRQGEKKFPALLADWREGVEVMSCSAPAVSSLPSEFLVASRLVRYLWLNSRTPVISLGRTGQIPEIDARVPATNKAFPNKI